MRTIHDWLCKQCVEHYTDMVLFHQLIERHDAGGDVKVCLIAFARSRTAFCPALPILRQCIIAVCNGGIQHLFGISTVNPMSQTIIQGQVNTYMSQSTESA